MTNDMQIKHTCKFIGMHAITQFNASKLEARLSGYQLSFFWGTMANLFPQF